MTNIIAGKLNFVPYLGDVPGRLSGTLQAGEKSLADVLTASRIKRIYLPIDGGGFQGFNPENSAFSPLKLLQPGTSYAIEAKESFEFVDALPSATDTFTASLLDWFETNIVSDSSNNFIAGKLNIFTYASKKPGRLTGAVGANEEDLRSVFTAARVKVIYLASDIGGFNAFNPASPNFSPLKVLQPGVAYAVEAIQSFNYGKTVPPPSSSFRTSLINFFKTNRPSGSVAARKNLGTNITGFTDYQSEIFLKDVFKRARTWTSNANGAPFGQGGALTLDANGYPTSLNTSTGQSASTPIFILPEGATKADGMFPTGTYVITYDGQGTLSFPVSDVTVTSNTPNRITVNYGGGDFWLGITATTVGNHVKNIKVFKAEDESTLATNPWNATFLQRIGIFKTIRFMDFLVTNNNPLQTWAERPKLTDYSYATNKGAPIELAIDLCNRLNADAWLCIPANVDDNYITQFAQLVASTLNSNLNVWLEYSNEIWNGIFSQGGQVFARAEAAGIPGSNFDKICRYQGRRSVEIFNAFETAFGGLSRIRRVVGGQHGNAGVASIVLDWNDPTVGLVKEKVDYLAIAPYFNGLDHPSDVSVADLDTLNTASMLTKMNADVDATRAKWNAIKTTYSNSRGTIPIIAYEGGQHLNPNSFPDDTSKNKALALYKPLQRSQAMYDAYRRYYNFWFGDLGDNALFCHFSSIYFPSRFGFWGSLDTQFENPDSTAKYRALRDILAEGGSGGTVNVTSAAAGALTVSWSGVAANTGGGTVNVASANPGALTVSWSGVTATPSPSPSPNPSPSPTPTPSARSAVPAGTVQKRWSAGNSVTDTVDYTGLNKLAIEAGYPNEQWGRLTIPGAPIDFIRDNQNSGITTGSPTNPGFYNNALTAFTWDHISFQPFDRSIAQDAAAIQSFIDIYKTASPNAQLWIYARWPLRSATQSENTAQSWRDKWNSTAASTVYPTGQTTRLFFENLTNTVRTNNPTLKKPLIIPVGHVMNHLHERLVAGEVAGYSTIWDVYQGADPSTPNDTVHLNDGAGSYLAACTYYSSIYFRSPVGLSRPAEYLTFSDQMRTAIQESVWAVVSTYSYTNGNY